MAKTQTPEEIIAAYLPRLVKLSTYAKQEDVSVTEVQRRADSGKIKLVKVGGVKFIELPSPTY